VMTTNLTPHELFNSLDRNMALISRLQAIFNEPLQMIGADRRIANSSLNAWGVR